MHHRRPRSSTPALSWRSSGPTTGDRGRHRDLGVAGCRRRCRLGGDTGVRSSESQDHGSLSRSCSTAPRCRSATPPPNRPLRPPARPTIQIFPTWRQAYPVRPPSTPGGAKGSQRWRHSRGRIRAAAMAPATSPSEISRIRASVSRTCAITQRNHRRELLAERIQTLYPLIRACGPAVGTPVIVWSRRRAGPEWPQAGSARTSRTSPRPRPRGR